MTLHPYGATVRVSPVVFNEETRASGLVVPYQGQTMQLAKGLVVEVGDVPGITDGDYIVYHECDALSIGEDVIVPRQAIIAYQGPRE